MTVTMKVYPASLAVLRARCRPGQSPAGALAELLAPATPTIEDVRRAWGDPYAYATACYHGPDTWGVRGCGGKNLGPGSGPTAFEWDRPYPTELDAIRAALAAAPKP